MGDRNHKKKPLSFNQINLILIKLLSISSGFLSTYLKYLEGLKTRAADELNDIFDICTYDLYIVHGIL